MTKEKGSGILSGSPSLSTVSGGGWKMIPEKDEYPMEQLKCPRCGGRLLDIGTDSPGKVEITTKCPKCNNLVTAVWEPKKE